MLINQWSRRVSNANSTGEFTSAYLDQLLREGIAAAKIGEKDMARTKLRKVTELDQYNEKAWFWLSSVVETDEERRVCLGNVVVINPDNDRAKQLLDQLIAGGGKVSRDEAGTGRMSPTELLRIFLTLPPAQRLIVAAGGIVALGLCLLIVSSISQPAAVGQPTAAIIGASEAPPLTGGGTSVASANQGGPTEIPATETPTPLALPSLPPSWTPLPSPTPRTGIKSTPLAAPPADLLVGQMLVSLGTPLTLDQASPISLYVLKTGAITPIIDRSNRGDWAEFMPDGRRVIYARYISGTNSQQIRIVNMNGTQGRELSDVWGNRPNLADHKMVSVSDNGKIVAFSAINKPENDASPDIYWIEVEFGLPQTPAAPTATIDATNTLIPVATETAEGTLDPNATPIVIEPTATATETATETVGPTPTEAKAALNRLTEKDSGNNVWPSVSPDGTRIVYVSDRTLYGQGVDLYLLAIGEAVPEANLSNDADALIEAAPRWSSDGTQIAFQAGTVDAKGNFITSGIYMMNADGSDRIELVPADSVNMRPVWSPDGAYIAFTSNRSGKNEIFLVEVATKTVYQLTSMPDAIVVQDWRP
jgi:Tol biopolymer transport system component